MPKPKLSIIVASSVGSPFINRCLESLESQISSGNIECFVVDRSGGETPRSVETRFPWVKVCRRSPCESVSDLRRYGIDQAKADHVAIIEEHCVARGDWIATILRSIQAPVAAVGGVVADANYDRLIDWAVYFTEYNSYMPPTIRGDTGDVCTANCVYRRDRLMTHLSESVNGFWEMEINHRLKMAGEVLRSEPDLVVYKTGPFGFRNYLRQRYLLSRAIAGTRRERVSTSYRAIYLLFSPLLIPLLWARTAVRVFGKRRNFGKFLRVTPYLIPITVIYVVGECVGFIAGEGDSLSKIE